MIVRISAEAERDLEAVGDFIAGDNPRRAVSSIQQLRAARLALADFPQRFPLVQRYEAHGIHRRLHGDYLIFYRVEPKAVIVLQVLHGAQDHAAVLFPP